MMTSVMARAIDGVYLIEMCDPDVPGALGEALYEELRAACLEFDQRDDVHVAVLHGSEGTFSTGEYVGAHSGISLDREVGLLPLGVRKPVIASVEGECYGWGFELALGCDLRVSGGGASFGFPDFEQHVPRRLASVLLPRMTSVGLALELLFTGRAISADQMSSAGLVHRVVTDGESVNEAILMASEIIKRFPDTEMLRKNTIWSMSGLPVPHLMSIARGEIGIYV